MMVDAHRCLNDINKKISIMITGFSHIYLVSYPVHAFLHIHRDTDNKNGDNDSDSGIVTEIQIKT